MHSEIKSKWVAALKSGEYKQGHYFLKQKHSGTTSYCCLGVLCDIYRQEHLEESWQPLHDNYYYYMHETEELPTRVAQWAGLKKDVPIKMEDESLPIYMLNDGCRAVGVLPHTFKELADIIENQL